jgi:hypothetical protein
MKHKVKYDNNYLQTFCDENTIELLENYSNVIINRDTLIKGKCKIIDCIGFFCKSFRSLVKNNASCFECSKNIGKEKIKKTNMEKYGCEYPSQNEQIREKVKQTFFKKYGCENPFQNKDIQEKIKQKNFEKYGCEFYLQTKEKQLKSKQTCIEKYGVENPNQNEEIKEKIKKTNLEKYGVENPLKNKEIREKIIKTNLEKYGVENPLKNKEIREKIEETMIERYGVKYTAQNKELREKMEETMIERYGVKYTTQNDELLSKVKKSNFEKYGFESVFQNEEIKGKSKETCLKKYGVENCMQNEEIMEKMSKNSYRTKIYTFPSGNQIYYQGYENYALDELLKEGVLEEEIRNGCKNVPEIWYKDMEGKSHRYYVDIFIPSRNLCIEVKSTWTIEKKKDNIFLKQQSLIDAGYHCEIWVYNGKGEKVRCYK